MRNERGMFAVTYGFKDQWEDVTRHCVATCRSTWRQTLNVPKHERDRMALFGCDPCPNTLKVVRVVQTDDTGEVMKRTDYKSGHGATDDVHDCVIPLEAFMDLYDLFWQYPAGTERLFYEQNRGTANYVPFPWATAIDSKALYDDDRMRTYKSYLQARIDGRRRLHLQQDTCFTCCQHIRFRDVARHLHDLRIACMFTPHKVRAEHEAHGVKLLPCALHAVGAERERPRQAQRSSRRYLFSFVGGHTQAYMSDIRPRIFRLAEDEVWAAAADVLVRHTGAWHFEGAVYSEHQNRRGTLNVTRKLVAKAATYLHVMRHSTFTLCPSGTGPNSIRLWEALALGSIPVVLSDQLELCDNADLLAAVVVHGEQELDALEQRLRSMPPYEIAQRRERCRAAYELFARDLSGGVPLSRVRVHDRVPQAVRNDHTKLPSLHVVVRVHDLSATAASVAPWVRSFLAQHAVLSSFQGFKCSLMVPHTHAGDYRSRLPLANVVPARWRQCRQLADVHNLCFDPAYAITMHMCVFTQLAWHHIVAGARRLADAAGAAVVTWKHGAQDAVAVHRAQRQRREAEHTAYYQTRYECDPVMCETIFAHRVCRADAAYASLAQHRCVSRALSKAARPLVVAGTYDVLDVGLRSGGAPSGAGALFKSMSVVVPAYNANALYMWQCLHSVTRSLRAMHESTGMQCDVMIGIDGCVQTLREVHAAVQRLAPAHAHCVRYRVFWFAETQGPYFIRNTLAAKSASDVLLFFDADDILDAQSVSACIDVVSPEVPVVRMQFTYFDDDDEVDDECPQARSAADYSVSDDMHGGTGQFFITRSTFMAHSGFHPWKCGADYEFKRRLQQHKVCQAVAGTFMKRRHEQSLTVHRDTNKQSYYRSLLNRRHLGKLCTPPAALQVSRNVQEIVDISGTLFVPSSHLACKHELVVVAHGAGAYRAFAEHWMRALRMQEVARQVDVVALRVVLGAGERVVAGLAPQAVYTTFHTPVSAAGEVCAYDVCSYDQDQGLVSLASRRPASQPSGSYHHTLVLRPEAAAAVDPYHFISAWVSKRFEYDLFVPGPVDWAAGPCSLPVAVGKTSVLCDVLKTLRDAHHRTSLIQALYDRNVHVCEIRHSAAVGAGAALALVNYDDCTWPASAAYILPGNVRRSIGVAGADDSTAAVSARPPRPDAANDCGSCSPARCARGDADSGDAFRAYFDRSRPSVLAALASGDAAGDDAVRAAVSTSRCARPGSAPGRRGDRGAADGAWVRARGHVLALLDTLAECPRAVEPRSLVLLTICLGAFADDMDAPDAHLANIKYASAAGKVEHTVAGSWRGLCESGLGTVVSAYLRNASAEALASSTHALLIDWCKAVTRMTAAVCGTCHRYHQAEPRKDKPDATCDARGTQLLRGILESAHLLAHAAHLLNMGSSPAATEFTDLASTFVDRLSSATRGELTLCDTVLFCSCGSFGDEPVTKNPNMQTARGVWIDEVTTDGLSIANAVRGVVSLLRQECTHEE